MAVKTIAELTAVSTISDSDVFVIDDGDHNYKISWSSLKALLKTVSSFEAELSDGQPTGYLKINLADGTFVRAKPSDPDKQDKLTFDLVPTENSNNVLTSGAIFTALAAKLDAVDYKLFTGATSSDPGAAGIVPAPASVGMYLSSNGAWETPDNAPTADSTKLITSGAVKTALDNVEIDVDSAMSDSSENPVQNKVITGKMKSTAQADKLYHLGFYVNANGDLAYDK